MAEKNTTNVSTPPTPEGAGRFGTSLIDMLGLDSNAVLSGQNVAQTVTNPVSAPTDALGIFEQQDALAGVGGYQTAANTAQKNFLDAQNLANQQQITLQGRRNKLGVMRGQQAQAGAQANMDLQTLGTANTLAQNALAQAQNTALQKANILYTDFQTKQDLMYQFPGLDINPLTDSSEDVTKALKKYKEEEMKDAEKRGYKDALRDLGLSTKGSRRELEKRLTKVNKGAADMVKRKSELDLQSLEMSIAKAGKELTALTVEEQLDKILGNDENGTAETKADEVQTWWSNWYDLPTSTRY